MNRWHRALQGFATDLAGTVLVTVAGFVATPIILSLTSQSLYGFWVLTLSIVGYMALLEFGVGMALTRHVASDIESRTPKELNALIATAFSFLSILGAGLFLVGFICSFFVPGWLGVPEGDRQDVVTTFRFALFSAALALPMSAFSSIIVGFNRMALDNTNRTVVGLMSLGLSILLLKMGLGLVSLAVAAALGVATIGLINALICRYMIPQITVGFAGANVPDIRRVLAFGGAFQVGRIANIVALSTDSLVLGLRLGTAAVTPYILTLKLANLLSVNLASKVPIALFPAVSSLYGSGNISGVRSAFAKVLSYSVRLAACSASLVLLVNEEFVTLWVGASNYGGVQLTVAFAVLVFFERPYFNTVTGVLLVMSPGIAWFMTKGVLSGIGEAATALTLHADKGVGKAGSKIGV